MRRVSFSTYKGPSQSPSRLSRHISSKRALVSRQPTNPHLEPNSPAHSRRSVRAFPPALKEPVPAPRCLPPKEPAAPRPSLAPERVGANGVTFAAEDISNAGEAAASTAPSALAAAPAADAAVEGESQGRSYAWPMLLLPSMRRILREGFINSKHPSQGSSTSSVTEGGQLRTDRSRYKRNSIVPKTFQGAFMEEEDLAQHVTATELDPVQAALVRKAFRLLDSMSSMVGEIGPRQMQYFAHHVGRLPRELQAEDDTMWKIEEFSQLCLRLIDMHGDEKFRVLVEGLFDSYAHKLKLHAVYWEGWAMWTDFVSIFTLYTLYSIALLVLWHYKDNMPIADAYMHLSGLGDEE